MGLMARGVTAKSTQALTGCQGLGRSIESIYKSLLMTWGLLLFFSGPAGWAQEAATTSAPALQALIRDQQAYLEETERLDQSSQPVADIDALLAALARFKESYASLDRQSLAPEDLYEAQFLWRFSNFNLRRVLTAAQKRGTLSLELRQRAELMAGILSDRHQNFYRVPQKSLPIEGIKGSDWPLSRWQNDPEFYKYSFEGDEVLYRGLRLRSGDLLLNHPIEKPVGLFAALAEGRNIFSHGAMVVFLQQPRGRLPVVVDVHERGIRAVPLHHYLGPKVLGYGEVFRFKVAPVNLEQRLDKAVRELMKTEHPYDLTGSQDRKALSCMEMVTYLLELMGEPVLPMRYEIEDRVFQNILRLGKLDFQRVQFPNDGFLDERFAFVGALDNPQSLETLVSNEVLLDLFREKMETKIMKDKKDLVRIFGEIAIAQVRSRYSLFGGFILGVTGFNRENFPAGDPALLTAVNSIDFILVHAMNRCLGLDKIVKSEACLKGFKRSAQTGLQRYAYSIQAWKASPELRALANRELRQLDEMFE
jgi:hypothetical protein